MTLLIVSIILFLAIFAIKFSNRSGVPALLLFIVLGVLFNRLGFGIDNFVFADQFATISLMIIMFQGGFSTNWNMSKPVAAPAIVLSSLGVVVTAILTGFFCYYMLGWNLLPGMLIGSIVGSTDYASVSNILRSKNLNLKYHTASLLELESGSNDPFAYTMTMIFLSVMLGKSTNILLMIFLQVFIGTAIGFALAFLFYWFIVKFNLVSDGLLVLYIVATSTLVYALTSVLQGNGFLAVYIYGIYLGNQSFKGKKEAVFFYNGFGELIQIGLFFMLGLLSDWKLFIDFLPAAAAIMFFMFIIARPLAVYLLTIPFNLKNNQKIIISVAGLRGAAAIAFAILATNSGVKVGGDIYNTVFGICVLSSAIQGFLMPPASRKFKMLDPSDTVLRTFNDYQDKSDLGFLKIQIEDDSKWINHKVKDLDLKFNIIIAKIMRDGKAIVPRGDTVIHSGDIIVLGGEEYFDPTGHDLVEYTIPDGHSFAGKLLKDLSIPEDHLVVMIQRRNGKIVVPRGNTEIMVGDTLISMLRDGRPDKTIKEGCEEDCN